jgi:hypothetical protein
VGNFKIDTFQGHWHTGIQDDVGRSYYQYNYANAPGGQYPGLSDNMNYNFNVMNPRNDGVNGLTRTGKETAPVSESVWTGIAY